VLHEHLLQGIRPGSYKLRVFARDRAASTLGGAETSLLLPFPGKDALAGPVLLLASRRHLDAPLPTFDKKSGSENHVTASRTGSIPSPGGAIRRGVPLEARTWICP